MIKNSIFLFVSIMFVFSCNNEIKPNLKNSIIPPKAEKIPVSFKKFNDIRIDDYYWLKERDNPEVIDYLERENDYYEKMTSHTQGLQDKLFNEIKNKIKEEDESVPYFLNGYWYKTKYKEGLGYPIYTRYKDSLNNKEEVLFDCNELAKKHDYFNLSNFQISPDNKIVAFSTDTVSRRLYTIQFKNLETGEIYNDKIINSSGSFSWANDNSTLFYTNRDVNTLRNDKIFKHILNSNYQKDELVYFEKDEKGEQLPYLEAIAITFLPDKQSEFLQFVQGKLDFISGLDNSYQDDLITTKGKLQKKYENKFNMITSPYLNTEYLGFFMGSNSSEIQSKKIRQAVNYGFNRDKMITYLRNGIGIPAKHGFIPKGLPGFNELDGFTYQPIKARDLVSQYIKETGNKNPSISIGTNSQYLDLCEYIQRELEKIGVKVIIDVVPPSTLRQLKSSGELDIFRASWIADYPDAENYLSLFYGKNFTPNGPNYTHFKNNTYDSLYESSLSVSNIDDRKLLYEKMDSIIINEAPVVPLYYDMAVRFVNKKVTGLGINPQNFLVLKRVKKSN